MDADLKNPTRNEAPSATFEILIVEDNPGDVDLTIEALREAGVGNAINVVPNGIEAIAYLRKQGAYAGVKTPQVVLLDLNLPKKDGREVLAEIKNDPELSHIPVVVLTSSDSALDVMQSYRVHANCYVKKPTDLERFMLAVRAIESFWLRTAKLPS